MSSPTHQSSSARRSNSDRRPKRKPVPAALDYDDLDQENAVPPLNIRRPKSGAAQQSPTSPPNSPPGVQSPQSHRSNSQRSKHRGAVDYSSSPPDIDNLQNEYGLRSIDETNEDGGAGPIRTASRHGKHGRQRSGDQKTERTPPPSASHRSRSRRNPPPLRLDKTLPQLPVSVSRKASQRYSDISNASLQTNSTYHIRGGWRPRSSVLAASLYNDGGPMLTALPRYNEWKGRQPADEEWRGGPPSIDEKSVSVSSPPPANTSYMRVTGTDLFRETFLGQMIRYLFRNKILLYPEERSDFSWPPLDFVLSGKEKRTSRIDIRRVDSDDSTNSAPEEKKDTTTLAPTVGDDGTVLVEWYATNDPANPQNWKMGRKFGITMLLVAYTAAVYSAASMYTPSQEGVMERFHVGPAAASLGLSAYIIGYGTGPLLWAPLSEIPSVGRNWVYVPTHALFVILCVPLALIDNYAGLLILRILTGFFGSPVFANGGASISDMFNFGELPIFMAIWTCAGFIGSAMGPLVAGYAVQYKGWRWGLWEILWTNAMAFSLLLCLLPETSSDNILRRRAKRLRKLTGRNDIKSQSEIKEGNQKPREVAYFALIKPLEIMIKDPAILFTNVYTGYVYGIYYSFFEAFPLIYPVMYGFTIGQVGLALAVALSIGATLGLVPYLIYQLKYIIPDMLKNGFFYRQPEFRLQPAILGAALVPPGGFLFAWTARPDINWAVSLFGVVIILLGNFWILQGISIYLALSYPKYAASLFAANNLCRASLAAGTILFARPLFINMGIGRGMSLLSGLLCGGLIGMIVLYKYGAALRARSKFTGM